MVARQIKLHLLREQKTVWVVKGVSQRALPIF
jgi:hypothetical protein